MAGDWIKVEHATVDKQEIVRMAEALKMDQDAILGKCLRLWVWADTQTIDGNALSVTDSFIDRLTYCTGFADTLRKVGWLEGIDTMLSIPNFYRHNGESAKKRALTKDRVKRNRNAPSVTKALPEKRREEKSTKTPHTPRIDTIDTTDIDTTDTEFGTFWAAYPRKENKAAARKAWRKADIPPLAVLLAAIDAQRQTDGWRRGFVPHASTWLNNARWEDEVQADADACVTTFDSDPDDPLLEEFFKGGDDE